MSSTKSSPVPNLDCIAQEIVDRIIRDLDITSICSLRLVCRSLGDRCCGQRYKAFFGQQDVDLTSYSLQRLCQVAAHPKFGPAVRIIAITAVVHDTSELERMLKTKRRRIHEQKGVFSITAEPQAVEDEIDEARRNLDRLTSEREEQQEMRRNESDVQLLTDALRKLGALDVLTIEAAVDRGDKTQLISSSAAREWHPIWVRASQVFRIVMSAIARSEAAVKTLIIYNKSLRCSVPTSDINELASLFGSKGFNAAAQHVRFLALSVSTKVETDLQKIANAYAEMSEADRAYYEAGMGTHSGLLSDDDPAAISEDNYPGVAHLLKQMPNLENLHLHFYNTMRGIPKSYVKVFSYIADEIVLPSLRRLTLRCFYCDEALLLKFLRAHPNIERLEMRDINLTTGSWSSVLDLLLTMPSLQEVSFHNLWKPEGSMLHLGPKELSKSDREDDGNSSFACMSGMMVHTRTFSRKDIQHERFQFADMPDGRQYGSPQFHRWITALKVECGPP
ncbi:MAG: hypothetical protein Q9215_002799 [Flavoplaca cf. flavocitrina]